MEQAPAITSVEAERAKANQNKLIAEACQRIIEQSPAVPYKSYEDAAEKLSAYHVRTPLSLHQGARACTEQREAPPAARTLAADLLSLRTLARCACVPRTVFTYGAPR